MHTPGPWKIREVRGDLIGYRIEDGITGYIAEVDGFDSPPAEKYTNARLIAAAPVMYNYLATQAAGGDQQASEILEAIHGNPEGR